MFFKKTSQFIVDYIVEFMKMNSEIELYSDENYISILRNHSEIKSYLSTINNKFNVGLTHMEKRYEVAEKPVSVLGFQPHVENSWDVFVEGKNDLNIKLVGNTLKLLFEKFNIGRK
jgi:hypothetical protein